MKPAKPADRKLHPIEVAIVAHIARYGLTTAAASVATGVRGMSDVRTAEYRLRALCEQGLVRRHLLTTGGEYYSLPIAAPPPGHSGRATSMQAQLRRFAMLQFCCGPAQRQKLTPLELRERFPELVRFGSCHNYYFTHSGSQPRFGFLRVDLDGPGRWDRIVAKILGDIHWHFAVPVIRTLLASDAFEVTLLTAEADKADRICERLQRKRLPAVPTRVESFPQLASLLTATRSN